MNEKQFTISEVIDSFGITKHSWVLFIILSLAQVLDGYDFMIINSTNLFVAHTFWPNDPNPGALMGSLTTWGLLGMVIGGAFGGILSDKIGRKKVLIGAVAFYGVFTLPQFPDARKYQGDMPEIGWFSSTGGTWRAPFNIGWRSGRLHSNIRPGQQNPNSERLPFRSAVPSRVDENHPISGMSPPPDRQRGPSRRRAPRPLASSESRLTEAGRPGPGPDSARLYAWHAQKDRGTRLGAFAASKKSTKGAAAGILEQLHP